MLKKKRLGKTNLMVSEVGFGGIPIIPLEFDNAVSVVQHCFDKGITFFDTANLYGNSEKMIGKALEGVRDQVVLATKTAKRDAQGAAKHIELSLENLRTDTIDLYQLHNIAEEQELSKVQAKGGALEALKKAQQEGKIKNIGVTSHNIQTAIKACQSGHFSTIQIPFNFIEKDPADELFKIAKQLDMGIIAMKPLGGGLLEKADLCFKFLQQHEDVIPIPGISKTQEIDEIVALYHSPQPLTDEDNKEIDRIRSELGNNFCHRCGYCLPCPHDVKIREILMFKSSMKRLNPSISLNMVKNAMKTVANCEECEECMEKCPYDLPIPEMIKECFEYYEQVVEQNR